MRTSGACLGNRAFIGACPVRLERDHHVVGPLLAVELTPSVGEQVLLTVGGGLAQRVGSGHLHVQALVQDLSVVSYRRTRVAGRKAASDLGR